MIQFTVAGIQRRATTDQQAFELLRDQSEPLIQAATRRAVGSRNARRFADDARQGAELGLLLAVRTYSEESDGQETWNRFAFSMMRRYAREAVRQIDRAKERSGLDSLDPIQQTVDSAAPLILENLPHEAQQVASLLTHGVSQRAAARALGVSRRRISDAVQQIRRGIQ